MENPLLPGFIILATFSLSYHFGFIPSAESVSYLSPLRSVKIDRFQDMGEIWDEYRPYEGSCRERGEGRNSCEMPLHFSITVVVSCVLILMFVVGRFMPGIKERIFARISNQCFGRSRAHSLVHVD